MITLKFIGDDAPGIEAFLYDCGIQETAKQVKKAIKKDKPIEYSLLTKAWEDVSMLAPKNEFLKDVRADTWLVQGVVYASAASPLPLEGVVMSILYARWCKARLYCLTSELAPEDDGEIHHTTHKIDPEHRVHLGLINGTGCSQFSVPASLRNNTALLFQEVLRDITCPSSNASHYEQMSTTAENLLSWWIYFGNELGTINFDDAPILAACQRFLDDRNYFDMDSYLLVISYATYKYCLDAPRPWPIQ